MNRIPFCLIVILLISCNATVNYLHKEKNFANKYVVQKNFYDTTDDLSLQMLKFKKKEKIYGLSVVKDGNKEEYSFYLRDNIKINLSPAITYQKRAARLFSQYENSILIGKKLGPVSIDTLYFRKGSKILIDKSQKRWGVFIWFKYFK